jgi:hypothetical protein
LKKEEFLKYYSALSNVDPLKILEEKANYQPAAMAAAEEILSTRSFHADELSKARAQIDKQHNKKTGAE